MPRRRIRVLLAAGLACALGSLPTATADAAGPTGRYLVAFEAPAEGRSAATVSAVLARAGVRRAGAGVPKLGIATVRGSAGALRALRRDPAVESVSPEYARNLRRVPNDPALSTPETVNGGLPGGAPVQWTLARQGFPRAWDITTGAGALVGVIDSGIDGGHPELSGKIASASGVGGASNPLSDEEGHGTHVSGLACAAADNGGGVAGAGWECRLVVIKSPAPEIPDEAVIEGIRRASDQGAHAINMSFGGGPPTPAIDSAIEYAVQRNVVLVAAASNDSEQDQGSPASQLQPGDAANLDAGRGLVVTAVDFFDRRADTGFGSQISLAAYGFPVQSSGPPGLISTYPGGGTPRDVSCTIPLATCVRRDLGGDRRYAYLEGTSMSTPQVAAAAALLGAVNPALTAREKLRLLKETARRSGGWSEDLGWGILDAGAALEGARRIDRIAPASSVRRRRGARPRRRRRNARVTVRWSGSDTISGPLVASGVADFDLYMRRGSRRYRRVRQGTTRRWARLRLRPGVYRFYTRARDRAGNVEAVPRRADLRFRVRRPRR
jgi:serine protease